MCAVVTLELLSGCTPADEATYHEMTPADLARLQAEEAGSVTVAAPATPSDPPDGQERKQGEPIEKQTTRTAHLPDKQDKQNEKPAPVSESTSNNKGEKNGNATISQSQAPKETGIDRKNPGKSGNAAAMLSPGTASSLPAKSRLSSNPARTGIAQPGLRPGLKPSSRGGLMQPGRIAPGALPEKIEKREPRLLIPEKKFRTEGKEGAIRVSFDDIDLLKVLNMEPVPENATKMFPDWLSGLNGKRIRIRGYMFPTLSQKGITYFQLVRDNEICCFGRTPKIYDRISTVLKKGEVTDYIQGRPFDVIGTLRIDPIYIDGEWLQLYLLEDAVVIDEK